MSTNPITELAPPSLWKNFLALNEVPRPSKREERVINFMLDFGQSLGLATQRDTIGNVVIKKPATPGMENRKTVILQSHLDMVHQKNADTKFDFDQEGIKSYIDNDWVKAHGTTLGADNGIGVAAIMAILQSSDISHPNLEALFTIDEETGMTGAKQLDESILKGDILLNLDTEEDDELTIGCAGGLDTTTHYKYKEQTPHASNKAFEVSVTGLKGGHSGGDIHLGRGNANKLMNRLLYNGQQLGILIAEVDGGGIRNAIPRESFATIAVPKEEVIRFHQFFDDQVRVIQKEFKSIEPNLQIQLKETDLPPKVMMAEDQTKVLNAIYAVPNGVFRMSPDIAGLVETSSNLAKVVIKKGIFNTQSLQRSSIESGKSDIANAVKAPFILMNASVKTSGDYPGWAPNPDSPILKTMQQLYTDLFDENPKVAAVHAGLECGIIGEHYPDLDMISFGPTIHHPHSPDEKVSIPSVKKFWKFLLATLENIPKKV